MSFQEKLEELRRRQIRAEAGGGEERRARQHAEGKLSARERLEMLFDPDSFEEIDMLVEHRCHDFGMYKQRVPGDAVVSGYGRINGRSGLCFRPGLHRLRRFPERSECRKDLQDHGYGYEGRGAVHRAE